MEEHVEIELVNGSIALVSPEDNSLVAGYEWRKSGSGYAYAWTLRDGKKRPVMMHRLIFTPDPGCVTDHKNRDKLDNRRCNLRSATHQENSRNALRKDRPRSGYKGVSFDARSRMWIAQTIIMGVRRLIGTYLTIEEAVAGYNEEMSQIHGEFFVPSGADRERAA